MTDKPRTEFTGSELSRLQAYEVVELLRRKEVSTTELLDVSFARIEAVSPSINATPTVCPDRARLASENIDVSDNDHPGNLYGLPIGIKDLTPVQGVRTTFGTKGLADNIPDTSDPLVERLEERGGVVVGKTNTPEFGAGGNTFNDVFGPTRNPWNTTLNAGGSSGGAAASLAAGEVWLSHGSDHGGSLRTPAAFCGVVGLRPSPGRISSGNFDNLYMIEGAQGPMARSTRDCALFLDAMSGFDGRYPLSIPAPETSFQDAVLQADGKLRIAYSADLNGFSPVDAEVREHLDGVLGLLQREGAIVEQTCPDLTGLDKTYRSLRGLMWAAMGQGVKPEIRAHFKAALEENIASGEALGVADIAAAHRNRSALYTRMVALFEQFDVLACPTVGCLPHDQSEEWVRTVGGVTFEDYLGWLRFAYLATVTGLPAISVPVGIGSRGLPVALQLIGKPRGEAGLLAAARAVEVAVGGPLGPIDPNVTHTTAAA
ncbi:amidase [Neptunicoccus cionae]|uniref:amidase n=1 Tax=Neptunicoccus cionae TaxID=2035344 RepID=UPI000C76BCA8|nr:amidase family protein [Amylibacter cionae]PLS21276.1 amidase [Amylibacter cionae]